MTMQKNERVSASPRVDYLGAPSQETSEDCWRFISIRRHVDSLCIAGDGQRTIPEKQVSHEENTFADRF